MKSLIFVLLLASTARAETRTYDATIHLCPNLVFENGESSFDILDWHGVIPATERPDNTKVFLSTWAPLTCMVKPTGDLTVVVKLPAEAYPLVPSQVPSVATCSAKDTKKNAYTLNMYPILLDASDMACWTSPDAWYTAADESPLLHHRPGEAGHMSLPLLSGHNFQSGTYQAKHNDGTAWTGVTCMVTSDQHMTVTYTDTAADDAGYCPVPDRLDNSTTATAKALFEIVTVN